MSRAAIVLVVYREPRFALRADGRALTAEDAGPDSGFPVLVHNGGGSRHLFPPAVRDARAHELRLIGYDRPAYGGSTPATRQSRGRLRR